MTSTTEQPRRLRRTLGLVQLTASGVGLIVGAGIYVLLAGLADLAGGALWLSFALAGMLSGLTALSYCELAAMYPRASAEHEYVRRVAPASVAFVTGWMMLAGLAVAAGAVALGFATYLQAFVDVPLRVSAWGLLTAVTVVALTGIERSVRVTVTFSAIQVGGLLVVVALGAGRIGDHSLVAGASPSGVVAGAALAFFAFVGFDEVITLSEEVRDPTQTVPRALLLALGISTLVYMAVAVVAVSVLGPGPLGTADQPLAEVVAVAAGDRARVAVTIVALLATANTTLLVVTAASRILFGMATTGAMPISLAALDTRQVPRRAVVLCAAVGAAFVALGSITFVASVTDMAVYVVFLAVNATVIALRFRQPRRYRPFRVPGTIRGVAVVPVAGLVATCVLLAGLEVQPLLVGAALLATGLLVYVLVARRRTDDLTVDQGAHPMSRRTVDLAEARAAADQLHVDPSSARWTLDDLRAGMEVELEHGRADPDTNVTDDDLLRTAKITLAHLNEIPDYYQRLAVMEAEGRAAWQDGPPST